MEWFFAWMLESSLLVLMIAGIRKMFSGKIPHALTYALWLIVLLRFLVPVNVISTPVSVANLVSQAFSPDGKETERQTVPETDGRNEGMENPAMAVTEPSNEASALYMSGKAERGTEQPTELYMEKTSDSETSGEPQNVSASGISWGEVFVVLWIAGAVILLAFIVCSNVRLSLRLKKNRVLYGHRGRIRIYLVSEWKNPCLYGCFRPAIYLPQSLISSKIADEEDVKQMIAHEYVHYRHKDHVWSVFRMLLVTVYWFHPFIWLAASCSKKDAELFCDEATIRMLGEEKRFRYGSMLVRFAGDIGFGDFFCQVMPMSRRGEEMKRRICAITTNKHCCKWILVPLGVILIIAVSITCSTGIGTLTSGTNEKKEPVTADGRTDAARLLAVRTDWLGKWEETTGVKFGSGPLDGNNAAFYVSVTPEEAFANYIEVFTDAVNTGDTSRMEQVLAAASPVYEQQCQLVDNYFRRGIREEVVSCKVLSMKNVDDSHVEIKSKEKIRVSYADGTSRLVRQKYRYTCEETVSAEDAGSSWKIIKMRSASPAKKNKADMS